MGMFEEQIERESKGSYEYENKRTPKNKTDEDGQKVNMQKEGSTWEETVEELWRERERGKGLVLKMTHTKVETRKM